ncbi:MAG: amino acid adenylation domain-containing protein [Verrucomicrobiales bacterium]|jgi:amino acid adenylation domain-containing protein
MLAEGRSGIIEVPENRWNRERYYHPDTSIPRKMHTKWGGFVDNLDMFDAQFWGISPREALRMDPQQRWLLECAWECMEDAGYQPSKLRGAAAGVYVGIASNDYAQVQMTSPDDVDVHTNSGSTLSIASNRIAYLLDFKGPALSVDTACSSALVAINVGCKDMWSGEIDYALVGGVNALLTPDTSIGFSKATMLSPSGQCFAFDDRANGYVRGEGAGMMMILPLSKAIANGDRIYATVRSAVINQDGNTSSMTVPGQDTQEMMLVQAYKEASMPASRVTYMEAHGTGTPVGDPIETNALGAILSQGREDKCLIGSVKTNTGHLESGSGAAGMVKAALVLSKGMVPPNLNFERPNPNIDFEGLKLKVVTELTPLTPLNGHLPVASVNSFGFGGTNAHIVLEAAPPQPELAKPTEIARRPFVLPVSGKDDTTLRNYARKYRKFIEDKSVDLAEIGYNAGARKEHHGNRAALIGWDTKELRDRLLMLSKGIEGIEGVVAGTASDEVSPIVFVFTGQGAQWWKMGQELFEREPVFRRTIESIDTEIKKLADWSLVDEMTRASEEDSNINSTYIAQPAIFALQVALADLWKSWGVTPSKVVGHSVGEVAAAYVAGAYTLEDAVKVIVHRSRLQESTGGDGNLGRMYALGVSKEDGEEFCKDYPGQIEVAVVNGPTMITLAGDKEALEELAAKLEAEGKFVRQLRINYAFHSFQMEPIKDDLLAALADIKPQKTTIPYISTVTGGALRGEELDGMYWWRNVRESVLFAPAMTNLIRGGERCFIELGPHPALASSINECLQEQSRKGHVFHSLKRKSDESVEILTNLAALHNYGVEIDWKSVNQAAGKFVEQPSYPWNREKHWLESEEGTHKRCASTVHPLLGIRTAAARPTFEFHLDVRLFPWLDDHRFWDSVIFPAAGFGEIGLALCEALFPGEDYCLEELEMKKALFVNETRIPAVRVVFNEENRSFEVWSNTTHNALKEWELNSVGRLRKLGAPTDAKGDLEALKGRMGRHYTHEEYYQDYEDAGYQFGPNFQQLANVWRRDHESVAEVEVPESVLPTYGDFHFHPAVLDACFHAVKGAQIIPDGAKGSDYFYLPAKIGRVRIFKAPLPEKFWVHAKIHFDDYETLISNILVYNEAGEPIAEIVDFRVDRAAQKDEKAEEVDNSFYQFKYEPRRLWGSRAPAKTQLTPISEVIASVNAIMPDVCKKHNLDSYFEGFADGLEQGAVQSIINAFIKLGWEPKVGDAVEFDAFADELGVLETHHRLLAAQLNSLAERGWLKSTGEQSWEVVDQPKTASVDDILDPFIADFPQFGSEAILQKLTAKSLGGVLCGEEDPVEVLFPGGKSIDALTDFYREGADFPASNELVGIAVQKLVAQMPERRAIRVLEVGAGTGSLTRTVLPALPAHRSEFTFTDTSPAFLADAKKQFSDYNFVEYTTFDIEKDPAGQGIDVGGYDLILGTNVIHATSDLKNTLSNITKCLAEDGVLMFLEVTNERASLNNLFGLLWGWWHYKDTELRPRSALMERSVWESLLKELDFRDVESFVSSPRIEDCQQAIFVAKAPVPQPAAAEETPDEPVLAEIQETVLVLSDESGVAAKLGPLVEGADFRVETLSPAKLVQADWEAKFAELAEAGLRVSQIIHLWTLDHPAAADISLADLEKSQETGVHSLLEMVKALAKTKPETAPKISLVTRGRMSIDGGKLGAISTAPMTGFCRVSNNEHPDYPIVMIDLDPAGGPDESGDLLEEILRPDSELEIAYRGDIRQVNRLHRVKHNEVPLITKEGIADRDEILSYRLEIDKPGVLSDLTVAETPRRDPDEAEIEIQVKAGGINFRDVMKALGMYPGNPVDIKWFGDDIAGTVVKVGEGVTDVKVGDNVVGMAPYAFRSFVTVNRNLVFKKPDTLTFEGAATLPTVFLTSHYALIELARMEKGERVLIHAGTGGVGSAAIQIAKYLGLEIFATAGSDEKRQLLKDWGVDHVMNSRTLDFADEIMEITKGEGIDCVLNSLAGDFIPKSFSCLRRFGRFVEIGKIDIYNNTQFGLEMLKNNISYFVVDLAQHLESKPAFVAGMLKELETQFYAGNYKDLPHSTFGIDEVVEAFRFMAQGKHIGKNVLNFDVKSLQVAPCSQKGHLFRGDRTFLITGGAGGFGFALAQWMVENGARHLALMSRSGPKEEEQAEIAKMEANGVTVIDARADVTDEPAVRKIIDDIQASEHPLCGVIHGAMVINDLDIVDLDEEGFNRVLHPKMLGAWILHNATKDIDLDSFISFSSFSTVIGAVRQSNYNAGNAFLDALSQHRHSIGLPALTFNWGALGGAGFVQRNEKTMQYLDMLGMKIYELDETLDVFSRFINRQAVNIACSRIDWTGLARFSPLVNNSKTYSLVAQDDSDGEGGAIRSQILGGAADARHGLAVEFLTEQIAGVFGTEVSKIDKDLPLNQIGLDSLMAIELMNRVESQLGINVPMGSVLNGPNTKELAATILDILLASASAEELSGGAAPDGPISSSGSSLPPLEIGGTPANEFGLTEGQKALWFLNRLAPESPAYNLVYSAKITPLVDFEIMKQAFAGLYERHPMLDVTFHTVNGQPVQRVHKGRTIQFVEHDVTALSDDEIKAELVKHANAPFNLETGPVMRLDLFKTKDDAHITLLCMHHIVSDAWSVTLFMNDLIESYFSRRMGKEPEWDAIPARYQDYVQWEQLHLESESGERMLNYWKENLAGAPMAIDLPTDRPRPAVQTFNGSAYGFQLEPKLTKAALDAANDANVTPFTYLLSAFEALFHRYTNQEDFMVGVPLAGRNQKELHDMVGYFINPVPVRSQITEDPTFAEFVAGNSDQVIGALENQYYPLAKLVDQLKAPRDPSRSPMFQISFSMEKIPGLDGEDAAVFMIGQGGHKINIAEITVESVDLTLRQAQFEITLVVEEAGGILYGCWQYNSDLFEESTIAYLNDLFAQVLGQVTANPDVKISEINLLSKAEETKILKTWNDTKADYPREQLLHELVLDQVSRTPDKIAVRSSGDTLTFSQLDRKSNGLAQELADIGVTPDEPVALLSDRTCDMVAGTMGILKAGACYVPMDPEFPKHRLELMLRDAKPGVIVTQRDLQDSLPSGDWKIICLEDVQPAAAGPEVTGVKPDNLAYIIYTSGSTGTPKGVEIPHRAAVNFLWSMKETPGLSEDDTLLAVTTLSFDISLLELYLPLLTGAEVVIASRDEVKDGRHLGHMLDEFDITVMQATPATWRLLIDGGWAGKDNLRVFSGGEPLPRGLADQLLEKAGEVWNLYGPTETTVWSTVDQVIAGEGAISIGKPIGNTTIYILDDRMNPVPSGFVGDLYIGGDGLARGYHGQPELTAEKFVEVALPNGKSERIYNTGDLARWRADGNLECLGRSDFQIKLRGVRMELDDIEAHVEAHPKVKQAVVIKRDDLPGGENLVAYVRVDGEVEIPSLRAHVAERLPESMRPAFFSIIEEFPLTPNKKVDRKRLPAPQIDRSGLETKFVAPQTASEQLLAGIFCEAFETNQIGIRDNFFELGGDSLLAVRILASASDAFNHNIPVSAFLRFPTIEQLANYLHTTESEEVEEPSDLTLDSLADVDHIEVEFVDEEAELPKVDAVAIACIPDAFSAMTGLSRDELIGQWFEGKPRLGSVYDLPQGKIGLVILPKFELDIFKDESGLRTAIVDALELSAKMGAKTVSLTGMLPSATDHGRDIAKWTEGRSDLPAVTTGDATRTATIIKTIEGALEQSGRKFADEKVAFVGLGSIGRGTVGLALEVLPHPAEILLCDPYMSAEDLAKVETEVRDLGYEGEITLHPNGGGLPPTVYGASFVVGTTSIPGILDVAKLQAGAIVVDYSFPPSFRVADAIKRIQTDHDILFTTGGELSIEAEITETIYLPTKAAELSGMANGNQLSLLTGRAANEITGCVVVSLLTGLDDKVKATTGPVTDPDVLVHYQFLAKQGFKPARLQMQRYVPTGDLIDKFKSAGQGAVSV